MQKTLLLVAVCAFLLAGCKKENEPTTYTGQVQATDSDGKLLADQSEIQITLTDCSPLIIAHTAADGTFSVQAPSGAHDISITKGSCGEYMLFQVAGGAGQRVPLAPVVLSQKSPTDVRLYGVEQVGSLYLIKGKVAILPAIGRPEWRRLFLKEYTGPIASSQIATSYALSLPGRTEPDGTFTDTITTAQLTAAHLIKPNGRTYVQVFMSGDNPKASSYLDAPSGRLIYPATNLEYNPRSLAFYAQ
jgi:hypothetical protein